MQGGQPGGSCSSLAGEYQGLDEELRGVVGEEGSDSSYVAQEESVGAC